MEQYTLVWKQKDYYKCTVEDKYEVASVELWDWHRHMYHDFESMYIENQEYFAMDFHGRILSIFYIEYEDEIYLPVAGSRFSNLPKITTAALQDTADFSKAYKLSDDVKDRFKRLIALVPPEVKPILDNKYDFKKRIGIDIWKNKRIDKNFGLDIWDKPVIVPLGCEPYL